LDHLFEDCNIANIAFG